MELQLQFVLAGYEPLGKHLTLQLPSKGMSACKNNKKKPSQQLKSVQALPSLQAHTRTHRGFTQLCSCCFSEAAFGVKKNKTEAQLQFAGNVQE